ncbi:MAG: hypothetical protein IPM54_02245 [Polyangiaceae bacterium]|nr:hypothetical protein [Polyangiaceae bacterium]
MVVTDGSQLDEAEVRQIHALRLALMRLRSDVDPDTDYVDVAAFVRKARYVVRALTPRGELRACFVLRSTERDILGRRCIVLLPEFGYAVPNLRGGQVARMFTRVMFQIRTLNWNRDIFIAGCGYPHSYNTFATAYDGAFHTLASKDIPALDRAVLEDFLREKLGRDDIGAGLLRVNVLHVEIEPRHLERLQRSRFYHEYVAQNPRWQDGYTLGFVVRADWRTLMASIWLRFFRPKHGEKPNAPSTSVSFRSSK